ITAGANQLFNYYSNALVDETAVPTAGAGGRHLGRLHSMMKMTSPLIDTAVYHPNLSLQQVLNADTSRLAMANFGDLLADIRRFVDYDLLDDRLILDGALDGKSILIIAGAMVMDARTTARINQWVRQGGVVFVLASRPVDWDGSTATMDSLVGFTSATDEVDGITEHVVPKPQALPSIASLTNVILTKGYTNLSGDCELLLAMRYDPRIGVAWRRKVGAGAVYAYYGPMDLKQQESTWVVSNRLPLRFMQDSFQACIAEKLLPQAPPTLNLDVPDLYKVLTTSGLWVLNMGAEPRDISYQGATIHVPALDIVHQPAAGPVNR
ncbi:MAG: hypothetical protein HYV75_04140, partial [Opitutae bacterium]|nr:hypothetical protein [Opitutae bacterium]